MKLKLGRFFLPVLGLVCMLLLSCRDNSVLVNVYQKTTNLQWAYIDKVRIPVKVKDTLTGYTLYLNLRHTTDYKYSNVFVLIHQTNPDGVKFSERKEFTLAVPDGAWLGAGSGGLYNHQIPFRMDYHFPEKGTYIFELEQNMRDNPLHNISDVGLRIEKNKE